MGHPFAARRPSPDATTVALGVGTAAVLIAALIAAVSAALNNDPAPPVPLPPSTQPSTQVPAESPKCSAQLVLQSGQDGVWDFQLTVQGEGKTKVVKWPSAGLKSWESKDSRYKINSSNEEVKVTLTSVDALRITARPEKTDTFVLPQPTCEAE
ncbi:hypothetical protein [Dactylosporangium sp. NPDC048998]|uniref:hypothetical protein n=1 Tax=Dactylosporangium sp. NPDC048998 TaxID=3363976 RepID=UPI0037212386